MIDDDPTEGGAGGPAFEAGPIQAVCTGVFYFGMVPGSTQYPDPKKKIMFHFTVDEKYTGEFEGYKAISTSPMTYTTNEEGNLGKLLVPYMGRVPTKDDLKKIDILLGRNVQLNVIHNEKGGKTYANVASVSRLMKGVPDLQLDESMITPVFYSVQKHTVEDFLKLPERGLARRTAVQSLSFTDQMFSDLPEDVANELTQYRMSGAAAQASGQAAPPPQAGVEADFDDDIPF